MIVYLLFGLFFILTGFFFEQRKRAKRLHINYMIEFQDEGLWLFALEKLVYEDDYDAVNALIKPGSQMFLFICNDKDACRIDINNKKREYVSFLYFQTLLKMLKKGKTTYQFTFQTISVYYHFGYPFNNCILFIKHQSKEKIFRGSQ